MTGTGSECILAAVPPRRTNLFKGSVRSQRPLSDGPVARPSPVQQSHESFPHGAGLPAKRVIFGRTAAGQSPDRLPWKTRLSNSH